MLSAGYYRYPTLHGETIVFGSEDDLWTVPVSGGIPRRLTSGLGAASHAALSPDGKWVAFAGREEGVAEVYVLPAEGGQPRRLTFLGGNTYVVGWTPEGRIAFVSSAGQPFFSASRVFAISPDGGEPAELPFGPASFVSWGGEGGVVIARHQVEPAYWKRYKGGTAGDMWVDPRGRGQFRRLVAVKGNPARPLWVGARIYFTSDHEGVANLYSCTPAGKDLRRHTQHEEFYVRGAATDGKRIVYHAGADLHVFDPASGVSQKIAIDYRSPRTQRNRKFIDAGRHLEAFHPHPKGHMLALTSRGKVVTLGNWEGAVKQHGEPHTGRYRLATWLNDGARLVAVSDAEGREMLVVLGPDEFTPPVRLDKLDVGRVVSLKASPKADAVLLSNVRNELILVDLAKAEMRVLDRSAWGPIAGFDWSPDGKWAAYAWQGTLHTRIIKLCRVEDGATFAVTRAVLRDGDPAFDPEGKYLYFLSNREFDLADPFPATLADQPSGKDHSFRFLISGRFGESLIIDRNHVRPAPPQLRITSADGAYNQIFPLQYG